MLRPPFKTSPAASQSTVYARFFKKLLPTSRQEKENKENLCCCRFSTNCEHDWGHLSLCTSVIPGFSLEGDGSGDIPKEAKNGWTEGDRKCLSARMISRTSRGRHYADCHLCSKVQARERGGPGCSGRPKMNRFNTVPPLLSPSLPCLFSPPCLPPLSLPSLFSLSLSTHL